MKLLITLQICGMVLLAAGAQGTIRQLIDPEDHGLLSWLPGGYAASLTVHIAVAVFGLLLGGWAAERVKKRKRA